jgi:DNA-binding MarR family transcriptional regulator
MKNTPAARPPSAASQQRKQPGGTRRLHSQGVSIIESVLSPSGEPVLGLYLHTVHILLINSVTRDPRFRHILPHLIGTPAILAQRPGLSQIELAALLGTTRANAGLQVAQCIRLGFVRRVVSRADARRYELFITPKGTKYLETAVQVVHEHEQEFGRALSPSERTTLRRLLMKVISGG